MPSRAGTGVWVQRGGAGGQGAETQKLCQGPFLSKGIRTGAPSANLGSATLNKQVRLGLSVHNWAKRASGKSPIPRKGNGSAATLPPTSHLLDSYSPPASRPGTPKLARDTQTQARPQAQDPLLKYKHTKYFLNSPPHHFGYQIYPN